MKAERFTNIFFALLFLGAGAVAVFLLYRDYQHLDNQRSENLQLTARRDSLAEESGKRERQLDRLENEQEYLEAVIRTKLNYIKDGERVFRFER